MLECCHICLYVGFLSFFPLLCCLLLFFVRLLDAFAKYSSLILLVVFLYTFRFLSSVFLCSVHSISSYLKGIRYSHGVIIAYKKSCSYWLKFQVCCFTTGQQANLHAPAPPPFTHSFSFVLEACVPGQRPFQRTLRTLDAESILKGTDPSNFTTRFCFGSSLFHGVDLV